jgi:hypothetical protein
MVPLFVSEDYFLSCPYNILTQLRDTLQQKAYDSYTYKRGDSREDNLQRGCPKSEHTLDTRAKPTAKIATYGYKQQKMHEVHAITYFRYR